MSQPVDFDFDWHYIHPDAVRKLVEPATAGPWEWRNTRDVYLYSRAGGRDSHVVMAFCRMGMQSAQPEFYNHSTRLLDPAGRANIDGYADARLIAAAPDIAAAYLELARRVTS